MQSTSVTCRVSRTLLWVIAGLLAPNAPAQTNGAPPAARIEFGAAAPSDRSTVEIRSEEIFSRFSRRVLLLTCDLSTDEEAQASGVLVSANGFVVTNAHVVEGCRSLTATYISGTSRRSYEAALKYYDKKSDAAVLKIEGQGFDFFNVTARNVHVGERVYAIGNPRGLEQSMSEGIVSGLRNEDGTSWIQHSAPISPGSSGGALISSRGDLLGINSWYGEESQNLNFAVPASTLALAYTGARSLRGSLRFPGLSTVSTAAAPSLAVPPPNVPLPAPRPEPGGPVVSGPIFMDPPVLEANWPPPSEQREAVAQRQRLTVQEARQRVLDLEKEISDTRASMPVLLPKDQFESTADYAERYQAWYDAVEPHMKPLQTKLQQFKQQFFLDSSVKPVFLSYDADAEVMTAYTGGSCLFKIPKASAKEMHDSWSSVSVARNLAEGDVTPIRADQAREAQPALALVSKDQIYIAFASKNDQRPSVISKVDPVWDPGLITNSMVKLSVLVDLDGRPEDIRITQSGGKGFDERAVEALKQWRFRPGSRNCVPAKVRASVEMTFREIR